MVAGAVLLRSLRIERISRDSILRFFEKVYMTLKGVPRSLEGRYMTLSWSVDVGGGMRGMSMTELKIRWFPELRNVGFGTFWRLGCRTQRICGMKCRTQRIAA